MRVVLQNGCRNESCVQHDYRKEKEMMRLRSSTKGVCSLVLSVVLGILVSCAPRGETKSLEEVFQIAKTRYERSLSAVELTADTDSALSQLGDSMQELLQADTTDAVAKAASRVEMLLGQLVVKAAYTNRPAIGELLKAYRGLTGDSGREVALSVSASDQGSATAATNIETRKLLVARSYNALSQELETTSFRVEKAGV